MIKRGDKRGQFYLTAAVIIIVVIITFAGINNSINRSDPVRIYDLKDELGIESGQVLDHGIYKEFNTQRTNKLLQDFTQNYSDYVESGVNLYFVFGNEKELVVADFRNLVTGEVGIQHGEEEGLSRLQIKQGIYHATVYNEEEQDKIKTEDKIRVDIEGNNYEFDLKPGDNFYFLIYQETEGGTFVEQG
tara:strand:- start:681 stop:1247 length:567 start_codon:yes stop_codon:yes gene_type:complete